MTPLLVVGAVLLTAALIWKLYQLWRAPHDLALRAVTLCLLCFALAYPMQLHLVSVEGPIDAALGPGMARLIQNLLQLVGLYWLMAFFLYSAGAPRRRARWELVPLVAAMLAETLAMIATPSRLRAHEFATADMTAAPVALFYLSGSAYFAYAMGSAVRWAWRYADEAAPVDRQLAAGLRLASIGLGLNVLGLSARTVYVAIRWPGGTVPDLFTGLALDFVAFGIVLLMIGVSYPGIRTRIAAIRRWVRHRRAHEQLRPLWMLLHDAYPADALHRMPTGPLRDLLAFRQVHRRYYRRVIECRDGLVKLSPYLAHTGVTGGTPREHALALRDALRMQARSEAVEDSPVRVATPAGTGLDADVAELVRLSQYIRDNG